VKSWSPRSVIGTIAAGVAKANADVIADFRQMAHRPASAAQFESNHAGSPWSWGSSEVAPRLLVQWFCVISVLLRTVMAPQDGWTC